MLKAASEIAAFSRDLPRQQPPLHLRRERQIAAQFLLLQHALRQPRILQQQSELVRRDPQRPFFGLAILPALGRRSQQKHAEHFLIRAQRHRQTGSGLM